MEEQGHVLSVAEVKKLIQLLTDFKLAASYAEVPNISLDYAVRIERDLLGEADTEVFFADRCEVFFDEHHIQWVKFWPRNGYARGRQHMIRTDSVGFTIVRDDG